MNLFNIISYICIYIIIRGAGGESKSGTVPGGSIDSGMDKI